MAIKSNSAYGINQPLVNVFPEPIKARRAPTVNDKMEIGTLWIDQVGNQAYTLTSIANNAANWSTNTTLGVGVFAAVEATAGDITCDAGDIVATVGDVTSGGAVVAGTNITAIAGDITVMAGDLSVNTGNIVVTTGNLRMTAGDIDTVVGDINSAAAVTAGTTITSAGDITSTAGNIITTAGNIASSGTVSAATGISTTAGGVTATAGNIVATAGNITAIAGNVIAGNDVNVGNDINVTGFANAAAFLAPTGTVSSLDYIMNDGGQFKMFGQRFLHAGNAPVNLNCYLGVVAGNANVNQGAYNVGIGSEALISVLLNNFANVAVGYRSLKLMTTGSYNIAVGPLVLENFTNGDRNIGIGIAALRNVLTGVRNIGIGADAGTSYIGAESSNICVGHHGIAGENNVMRLGTDGVGPGEVSKAYIAGELYSARSVHAANRFFLPGTVSISSGAGDPNGVVTAGKGSLYLNTAGSGVADRAWINTDGATTWTNLTTAA